MAVNLYLITAVLLTAAPHISGQNDANAGYDCLYMTQIPRPERPDWPELNFDGETWATRPLLPAPDRLDLCMDAYHPAGANAGTQLIFMEEEIEGDVAIAKLNYQGTATPELTFVVGRNLLLGAVVRQNGNGDWYIYVTQRQDYEEGMVFYTFNVHVEGQTLVPTVSLTIVNIDDNIPWLHILDPCQMEELGAARLTECVYDLSDADGQISTTAMTFEIISDRGDEEIFFVRGENVPGDWFSMKITVGITEPLNFEQNPLHIFTVHALDSLPNTGTASLMVQVVNVESRPPRWMEIFAVQQFDEKEEREFTVRAIDGDTAINKPILYDIITEEGEEEFFSITTIGDGCCGATLHVASLDRDTLEREVFRFTIIAYKEDNREQFSTEAPIVIIINDINDQRPVPQEKELHIRLLEETPLTLDFGEQIFGFHDRDLGENAQYTVELETVSPPGVAAAFYVAPQVGYQRQTFIMGTVNHAMLDYEEEEFQHIEIRAIATDMLNATLKGEATLYIDLINWNDEEPIFEEDSYFVSFDETEGAGFYVTTVLAKDRDVDDEVVHSLMGNAAQYLSINETTGEIRVSVDDAFDYHRQNELFVQVRAVDTLGDGPYHTVTTQLVIQLNDINNTPPSLRLPRGSPSVEENVPEGEVITTMITATDPDTTAYLKFEIVWETSYATKQGRETPAVEFHNCVEIQTVHDEGTTGSAHGHLIVKEIRDNVTIDFEEFEVLYLTVRVIDEKTVIGVDFDEMTFTIIIIDMNDNWPIWSNDTLEQEFRVRENSTSNVVIGSVLATDIDGPLYNQVRYTIVPIRDTPVDLVKIDFYTGQITTDLEHAIDADVPRTYLYYTVIASDRCYEEDPEDCPDDPEYWDTPLDIAIYIIDTNNKVPQAEYDEFPSEVYIYEDAGEGAEVVQLVASDMDRDDIHKTVRYQINYVIDQDLRRFFAVDVDTGLIYVEFTTDEVLDRDGDEPTHRIFINLIDNLFLQGEGTQNTLPIEVLVILLDVNDNPPVLPSPEITRWPISEGLDEGSRLSPRIHATDRDELFTDNSRVSYQVVGIRATDRDIEVPMLFAIQTIPNTDAWEFYGELYTYMDLRGYWGTYEIQIRAHDHGDPMLDAFEWYEVEIAPYNFHSPEFVFPLTGTTVRLSKERSANGPLVTVADAFLDNLHATDDDGLHAGLVDFSVSGNVDAIEYFEVENLGDNRGELRLRRTFAEDVREFQVTIRATDRGTDPGPLWTETVLNVIFVPSLVDPTFDDSTATVAFFEQEVDGERHRLPAAEDLKNHACTDDCYPIYYRIVDGNTDGHFELDASTNTLWVVRALDREVATSHQLLIAASNSPAAAPAAAGSTLAVTVNVREANPRPTFVRELYTAGISTLDVIGRQLLVVQATHSENAAITYSIDHASMQSDSSLDGVRDVAFTLGSTSGVLTLGVQPTAAMHGMFEFDVVAEDAAGASDTAEVKVYLISTLNRVTFIFVNTVEDIEANRGFIAETFSTGFSMTCNIDQVLPATNAAGVAQPDRTEVRSHFIRDHVPVPAEEMESIRDNTQLLFAIQMALRDRDLQLSDFVTELSPDDSSDNSLITIYVLAALSAALAFFCLLLLITFCIRTRTLNRRLEALSMTKYGSVDSGLNRAGLAAPNTNKFTAEGANPIWNETFKAPDFDAMSDASNDSDLIGIEDLPQFRNDFFPPADTESFQGMFDSPAVHKGALPNHSNNFGFNTSPFSSDFTDRQFKRP